MLKLMERGEPIVKDLGNADASSGGRKLEVDAHSTGCSDTTGLETAVALTNHWGSLASFHHRCCTTPPSTADAIAAATIGCQCYCSSHCPGPLPLLWPPARGRH